MRREGVVVEGRGSGVGVKHGVGSPACFAFGPHDVACLLSHRGLVIASLNATAFVTEFCSF